MIKYLSKSFLISSLILNHILRPIRALDSTSNIGSCSAEPNSHQKADDSCTGSIQTDKMPAFFISHGAPTLVIEKNEYTDHLKALPNTFPRPKAIVIFSAHWDSYIQKISNVYQYSTIYDFYGFPDELYKMTYPAYGDYNLAKEIQGLFAANGIPSKLDESRGLDHGAWSVLKIMYPDADIPVIALSVDSKLGLDALYNIGKSLAPLREKGILIIGSGGTVHNLMEVDWDTFGPDKWAVDFDKWIEKRILDWNTSELFEYRKQAPYARKAVPTAEHFVPLILAMGAGDTTRKPSLLYRNYQFGSLSLSTWRFD